MDSDNSIDQVANSIKTFLGVNVSGKTPQVAVSRTRVLIDYKYPDLASALGKKDYFVTSVYNTRNFKTDALVIIDLQSKNDYKNWKEFYDRSQELWKKFNDVPAEAWHLDMPDENRPEEKLLMLNNAFTLYYPQTLH